MTSITETINNRQILYFDIDDNLEDFISISLSNWILFVIVDDIDNPILNSFAELCIDRDVLYVCATGKACSQVDDLFDTIMVIRELEGKKLPSWLTTDQDVLMTTWHYNFGEGFWFATTQATYEDLLIEYVLVVNFTNQPYFQRVQHLTKKINDGWLPPD